MSFNIALNNAYSGLSLNSRQAEIVARNVANAGTDGYAVKGLAVGNRVIVGEGGGVVVKGVTRAEDMFLTADRRRADARAENEGAEARTLRELSALLAPDEGGDVLAERFAALDSALAALEDSPESETNRLHVIDTAASLARSLAQASETAGRMADAADDDITTQIEQVNAALVRIEELNGGIREAVATDRDPTMLMDERDRQIELVNAIIPVRSVPTSGGGVTLYTEGSAVLMDDTANQLDYTGGVITLNGRDVTPPTGQPYNPLRGGRLDAAFAIRDELVPAFRSALDGVATDLVARFGESNVADPSMLDAGNAAEEGLFVLVAGTAGAAERIAVNPLIEADSRRLRDGAYTTYDATTGAITGPAGHPGVGATPNTADATVVSSMLDAFRAGYDVEGRSITQVAEALTAGYEKSAQTAEQKAAFSRATAETLLDEETRVTRVDTDAELRALLEVEKAYAANARVMSVIDQLINRILEI